MKHAHAIYYYLYWHLSIDFLNEQVRLAVHNGDREKVEFYCKVIALQSMGMEPERFWELYLC
jgi:hypothetical protein